jgi:hypothetical protein
VLAVAMPADSEARAQLAADTVQRTLDGRLPDGVRVERRIASWNDLESVR